MRAEALLALLEEERRALLAGDWGALDGLRARKEGALARLARAPLDGGAGRALQAALGRNRALLRAALDGLGDAARAREGMRAARAGLVTYDARGARAELPVGPPRVERRA